MEISGMSYGINAYGNAMQKYNDRKLSDPFNSHMDKYLNLEEDSKEEKKLEEDAADTDIVVKPDGSRVLVMTTHIGGMSAVVSMKISEPTKMPNESNEIDTIKEEEQHVGGWNKGTGNFTAGSERSNTHVGGV